MHPKALLDTAAALVARVLAFDHPADATVARFFREHRALGPRERATLSETVYALLRHLPRYRYLAESGSGPRERCLAALAFAAPREFLAAALRGDEARWLAACDATDPQALPPALRHNLPEWLAEAIRVQVGAAEFDAAAHALLQPAPLDLRVNLLKSKRPQAQAALREDAIESIATPYAPLGLRVVGKPALQRTGAFLRGEVEVQDEGSQLLALLLGAQRGELVVDFCAGAGGKTLAIAAAMRNTGRLYAFDTSAHRLEGLSARLARAGVSNVHTAAIAHERDARVARLAGKADRVLVDAPCSGLGTLRRSPDLMWRQSPEGIAALAAGQGAILAAAARLVKPGGRLVYATCSLLPEENEAVARAFGAAHAAFKPEPAAQLLDAAKVPGAAALCEGEGGQWLRLWPHRHGTDGFFAAAWSRKAG